MQKQKKKKKKIHQIFFEREIVLRVWENYVQNEIEKFEFIVRGGIRNAKNKGR